MSENKRQSQTNAVINNKLLGRAVTYLRCGGIFNNQIKTSSLFCLSVNFFKSVNIWHSYGQKRDYVVHFLRLLAVCWPGAQRTRDNHLFACNFAKYSPIVNIFFSLADSANLVFLSWFLIIPPHLEYVATLPCNLSLVACFLTLIFNKVMWQHMLGLVGFSTRFTAHLLGDQSLKEFLKYVKI